jgi:probable addiction module antidote protein
MTIKTEALDPAEFLDTPEAVAEYLAAAFESDDHAVIADALGVAAKARGMS